jgi:hypothetical protein
VMAASERSSNMAVSSSAFQCCFSTVGILIFPPQRSQWQQEIRQRHRSWEECWQGAELAGYVSFKIGADPFLSRVESVSCVCPLGTGYGRFWMHNCQVILEASERENVGDRQGHRVEPHPRASQ